MAALALNSSSSCYLEVGQGPHLKEHYSSPAQLVLPRHPLPGAPPELRKTVTWLIPGGLTLMCDQVIFFPVGLTSVLTFITMAET